MGQYTILINFKKYLLLFFFFTVTVIAFFFIFIFLRIALLELKGCYFLKVFVTFFLS